MENEDASLVILVAVIGLLGVALGGAIQVMSQRWVIRHDRMLDIRIRVAEYAQNISGYTAVLVHAATVISGAREDLKQRLTSDPLAEIELSDDYFERLGDDFFKSFDDLQRGSMALMSVSDRRVADKAGQIHLEIVDVQNEVGYMFAGTTYVPPERATDLQKKLNREASILLTMVGPRRREIHHRFRRATRAERLLVNGAAKRRKAAQRDGSAN